MCVCIFSREGLNSFESVVVLDAGLELRGVKTKANSNNKQEHLYPRHERSLCLNLEDLFCRFVLAFCWPLLIVLLFVLCGPL